MAVGLQLRSLTDMLLVLIICFVGEESSGFRKPKRAMQKNTSEDVAVLLEGAPAAPPAPSLGVCSDDDGRCPGWAATGECDYNPQFMIPHCKQACGLCPKEPPPIKCVVPNVATYDASAILKNQCTKATARGSWRRVNQVYASKTYTTWQGHDDANSTQRVAIGFGESAKNVIKHRFVAFKQDWVGSQSLDALLDSFMSSSAGPLTKTHQYLMKSNGKYLWQWYWSVTLEGEIGTIEVRAQTVQSDEIPKCLPGKEIYDHGFPDLTYQRCYQPDIPR